MDVIRPMKTWIRSKAYRELIATLMWMYSMIAWFNFDENTNSDAQIIYEEDD